MTDFNGLKSALEKPGFAEEELARLARDYYSKVEFAVQLHHITRLIPPGASVLDIGSGPGRYAVELLRRGNKVALADLSESFLKKAGEEIARQGLQAGVLAIKQQNAVRLDAFGDAQFDHALLLGPVFYMDKAEERRQALAEAARVVKPGGLVFLTMLSSLRCVAEMFYVPVLKYRLTALDSYAARLEDELGGLNSPQAVRQLIADCGLEITGTYGADSAAGMAFDKIDEAAAVPGYWEKMVAALVRLSAEPALAGLSSHTTYILRKPAA
ncbi:MAG: class I SAM-dependent methyltransferase [Elusimicrobiales bacterium]|nr:class I SAM-dependent methyltransferase [Elusimicrobiales bacterium]